MTERTEARLFEERCTLQDAATVIELQRRLSRIVQVRKRHGGYGVSLLTEGSDYHLALYDGRGDQGSMEGARGAAETYRRVTVQGLARAIAGVSYWIEGGRENPIFRVQQRDWEAHQRPSEQAIAEKFIDEVVSLTGGER